MNLQIMLLKPLLWSVFWYIATWISGKFSKDNMPFYFIFSGITFISFFGMLFCLIWFVWDLIQICWQVMIK